MSSLPLLQRVRHEMMFVPGPGAVHRAAACNAAPAYIGAAPHHSAPYVCLVQRASEIEALLAEPGSLESLSVTSPNPESGPWSARFAAASGGAALFLGRGLEDVVHCAAHPGPRSP